MNEIIGLDSVADLESRNSSIAILPVGSFEQHGRHLPVTTDTLIACLIAKEVAKHLNALLISPITVSCSHEHAGFSGTLSVSPETLIRVVKDILASSEQQGVKLLVVVNGHGGNYLLGNVAQEWNSLGEQHSKMYVVPGRQHWQAAMEKAGAESSVSQDMHGGEVETSILLHAIPAAVKVEEIQDHSSENRQFLTVFGMRYYTKSGVIGFPSKASAEKGRLLLNALTGLIVEDVMVIMGVKQ